MAIKLTCQCGQSFALKDSMAGQTAKCPKCAQPLKVPAPASKPPAQQQRPAQPQRSQQPRPKPQPSRGASAPAAPGRLNGLLDEIGLAPEVQHTGPRCPSCGAPVQPNSILCVQCGYDSRTGQRLQTVGTETEPQDLSDAERSIARAAKELTSSPLQDTGSADGLMAYVFTLGLLFAVAIGLGLGALFMYVVNTRVFPEGEEQTFRGTVTFTLYTFGTVVVFLAYVEVVGRAFNDKVYQGLMAMLPIYTPIYAIMKSVTAMRAVVVGLIGLNMYWIATWLVFEPETADPGASTRAICLFLSLGLFDLWFVTTARIIGMAFEEEENRVWHGTLCFVVPFYLYIFSVQRGKKYIVWAILSFLGAVLCAVFTLIFLFSYPEPTPDPSVSLLGFVALSPFFS